MFVPGGDKPSEIVLWTFKNNFGLGTHSSARIYMSEKRLVQKKCFVLFSTAYKQNMQTAFDQQHHIFFCLCQLYISDLVSMWRQDKPTGWFIEKLLIFSELKEEDFHINYTCRVRSTRGKFSGYFTLLAEGTK